MSEEAPLIRNLMTRGDLKVLGVRPKGAEETFEVHYGDELPEPFEFWPNALARFFELANLQRREGK